MTGESGLLFYDNSVLRRILRETRTPATRRQIVIVIVDNDCALQNIEARARVLQKRFISGHNCGQVRTRRVSQNDD